jgi:hypothetical protein
LARARFRLLPFRSPLLREYRFHRLLRCFSSPGALRLVYVFNQGCSSITSSGLPHSEIAGFYRSLPTPRRLSQVAASFFGSWCLGIHLGPLLACSTYNHSSTAEATATDHVKTLRKRIQILLYGILEISIDLFGCQCAGGDERIRTADPLLAKQVLSQLSYIPWGTRCVLLATSKTDASLRTRINYIRGRYFRP